MNEDFITLEFDNEEVECEVMGIFELNGNEYMALAPQDESDDIYIYGYKEISSDDDGVEFELTDIDDDKEFDDVVAEFDRIMEDVTEDETLN